MSFASLFFGISGFLCLKPDNTASAALLTKNLKPAKRIIVGISLEDILKLEYPTFITGKREPQSKQVSKHSKTLVYLFEKNSRFIHNLFY